MYEVFSSLNPVRLASRFENVDSDYQGYPPEGQGDSFVTCWRQLIGDIEVADFQKFLRTNLNCRGF